MRATLAGRLVGAVLGIAIVLLQWPLSQLALILPQWQRRGGGDNR